MFEEFTKTLVTGVRQEFDDYRIFLIYLASVLPTALLESVFVCPPPQLIDLPKFRLFLRKLRNMTHLLI